jgi:hypothetical protein
VEFSGIVKGWDWVLHAHEFVDTLHTNTQKDIGHKIDNTYEMCCRIYQSFPFPIQYIYVPTTITNLSFRAWSNANPSYYI